MVRAWKSCLYLFLLVLMCPEIFSDTLGYCLNRPCAFLSNGRQLEGTYQTTFGGRKVSIFTKVPYGKAQRFAAPVSVTTWPGVLDASSPSPKCLQNNPVLAPDIPAIGEEDCLNLDVGTPYVRNFNIYNSCPKLLPVVVLLPTVAFAVQGTQSYSPLYLLDQEVVTVGINSRLSIMGYLSTEDPVIPGNWGMKDQVLGLKWIQDNIAAFCGDPHRVTTLGDSAGAASALIHSYSPLSKGLSQRAIGMGGSPHNYWTITINAASKAHRLGKLLNCSNVEDSKNLLSCLRSKRGEDIVAQYPNFMKTIFIAFGPVIEPYSRDAFLTIDTMTLLQTGQFEKKPFLLSTVKGDGLFPAATYLGKPELLDDLNTNWIQKAPDVLNYREGVADCDVTEVTGKIRSHYFGDKAISNETVSQVIKVFGDRLYVADSAYATTLLASLNTEPVYYYIFNYVGTTTAAIYFGATYEQVKSFLPSHADDIGYAYNTSYLNEVQSKDDIAMMKALTKMIATFAATGKAEFGEVHVPWEPVPNSASFTKTIRYLKINSATDYHMDSVSNLGDFDFWNTLPLREPATVRIKNKVCQQK